MTGLRALLRIEWRDALRHRGRTALAVSLVALTVAATVVAGSLAKASRAPSRAVAQRHLGRAALRVDGPLAARLAGLETHFAGEETVALGDRTLTARFVALGPAALDGLARGMFTVVDGRLPRTRDELAVSPGLADALGTRLGARVTTDDGVARVVGVVEDPARLDASLVVRAALGDAPRGAPFHLAEADRAEALAALGLPITRREDLVAAPDAFESSVALAGGAFLAFEVGLVLAAAFAVAAPRRRRVVGLVASCGARPSAIRLAAALGACASAAVGALVGVAVAAVALRFGTPWYEAWLGRRVGVVTPSALHAFGATLLATTSVVAAVVVPTLGAARTPVVALLRPRRAPRGPSRRVPAAVVVALALAAPAVLVSAPADAPVARLASGVLWMVAAALAVPHLLSAAARHAARLPLTARLAVRDASRTSARSAPVVVGVAAVATLTLQVAALVASVDASGPRGERLTAPQLLAHGPGAAAFAADADALLAAAPLRLATLHGRPVVTSDGARVAVGDEALLAALAHDGALRQPDVPAAPSRLPFVADAPGGPLFVVPADVAASRGWLPAPPPDAELTPWLLRFEQADAARRATADAPPTVRLESPAPRRTPPPTTLALVVSATALAVAALVTGLGAAESAADAATLQRVGAAPALVARVDAARAGYLALVGAALAVPAALVPAAAWTAVADVPLTLAIPWGPLALVLLGLPLVTCAVMRLVAAARPLQPSRAA